MTQTFYDTTGYTYPADHAAYDSYVATYADASNLQGTRTVSTIDGSGNPFDSDSDYYLSIFNGTLNIAADGTYNFAVDGDDAVEFLIDINGDGDFDDAGEVVAVEDGRLVRGPWRLRLQHVRRIGHPDSRQLHLSVPAPGGLRWGQLLFALGGEHRLQRHHRLPRAR